MFKHILVPLDGSSLAECVLPHAVVMAQAFEAQLTLLSVQEHIPNLDIRRVVDPLDWQMWKAESNAYLEAVGHRIRLAALSADIVLLEGQPASTITNYVHKHGIDLIVLSSHGQSGLSEWSVSSVVQKIINRARASILLVRAYLPWAGDLGVRRYQRVLVLLDGSRRTECALEPAVRLAKFCDAQILLGHVVRRPEMPRRFPLSPEDTELSERITQRNCEEAAHYLDDVGSSLPREAEIRLLVSQDVAASLHGLAEQEQADLLVMCAHGYSGRNTWPYGSVTSSFIAYGNTPLLLIQDLAPDEWQPTRAELAAREHWGH